MKLSNLKLQSIERWIGESRTESTQLEIEADGRLGRLSQLSFDALDALKSTPMTLGLYGHSTEGKHHLLTTLIAENGASPCIELGDKVLNYLMNINPGVAPTMAIRFTRSFPPQVKNHPVLLELYSEIELIVKLIQRYHARKDVHVVSISDLATRIAALQEYRLPQPIPGMNVHQFAVVTQVWKSTAPHNDFPDDGLFYQMAELAGWLSITDRASLLSFLWGDDASVTEEWMQLANMLAQLGYAEQVLAPIHLIVDNTMLPAEGFLFPASQDELVVHTDVMICPLDQWKPKPQVSMKREYLARLCACVTLTVSPQAALGDIDIIDIPVGELDRYARKQQPDMLLLCNAADEIHDIDQAARTLCNWFDHTQGETSTTLPRLIWAVTPFDQRFHGLGHLDDGTQCLLNDAGHYWGILQALDNRNLFTLREWLADALNPKCRKLRLTSLAASRQTRIEEQLSGLITAVINTPKKAENLVRALQTHSENFGELTSLLTLSRPQLHQCWLQYQQKPGQTLMPKLTLDLFASNNLAQPAEKSDATLADIFYKRWVNHVRQLSWHPRIAEKVSLPKEQLNGLCDVLIVSAHRLGLYHQLRHALAPHEHNMALALTCAGNVFNDFISWLGYQHTPLDQRPDSKVNQGSAIFAPVRPICADERLTRLGVHPGHTRYIYDWLVGLYHRAMVCASHPHNDIPGDKQLALQAILNTVTYKDVSTH